MNEKGFVSEKRFVSKKNLSRAWRRLFGKVLNSKEEIEANTSENMIAGAEAVKEVYSSLANGDISFSVESDGAYVSYKVGADSVTKKLGSEPKTVAFSNVTLSRGSTETRTLNSSYGTLLYAVITSMSYLYKGSESYTGYVSQSISGNTVTFKCTCGGGVVSATVSGYFVYV